MTDDTKPGPGTGPKLGLGALVLGTLVALVGAALAGRKPDQAGQGSAAGEGGTAGQDGSAGQGAADAAGRQPVEPARPGLQPAPEASKTDGPSGPTAHAQPAPTGQEGHAVPDLAAGNDLGPDHRAPEAFRPDMDAPMTAAEREALRPATGPSPSLVSDQGASVQGPGGDLR